MYLGSISKTLVPGLRVAWMVAPARDRARASSSPSRRPTCAAACSISGSSTPRSSAASSRSSRRRCARTISDKRDVMETALRDVSAIASAGLSRAAASFCGPTSATASTTTALFEEARRRARELRRRQRVLRRRRRPPFGRLSFSAPSHDGIREGVARLARALDRVRTAARMWRTPTQLPALMPAGRRGQRAAARRAAQIPAARRRGSSRSGAARSAGADSRRNGTPPSSPAARIVNARAPVVAVNAPMSVVTSGTSTTSPVRSGPAAGRDGEVAAPPQVAVAAIERAQHVVERGEVDVLVVGHRRAGDVGAGALGPADAAAIERQAVQLVAARADEQLLVERQHAGHRLVERRVHAAAPVSSASAATPAVRERDVEAIPDGRRRDGQRRAERLTPQRCAPSCARSATSSPVSVDASSQPVSQ